MHVGDTVVLKDCRKVMCEILRALVYITWRKILNMYDRRENSDGIRTDIDNYEIEKVVYFVT